MIAAKWDITSKCNLRCTHCSVAASYFSGSPYRNLPFREKVLVLEKLAAGGVTDLSLLGGEPLTLGKELLALISHANQLGMKVGIVTNAVLLHEATCRELVEIGLDRITVSLESAHARQHDQIRGLGTFDAVVRNLRQFSTIKDGRRHPTLCINSVLCAANRNGFADLIRFCQSLGAEEWTALTLNHTGNAQGNLASLILDPMEHTSAVIELATRIQDERIQPQDLRINIQLIYPLVWEYITKKHGITVTWPQICCSAARSLVYLAPNGEMHLCDRVHASIYSGATIRGERIQPLDLVRDSFADAWSSSQYAKMFQFVKDPETYAAYSPCRHCKYLAAGLCEPCPLYSLEGKAIRFSQCLEAEKSLGDISGPIEWNDIPPAEQRGRYGSAWSAYKDPQPEDVADTLASPERVKGIRYFRYSNGDALVYNPETAQTLKMNPMANAIWEAVDGLQTTREIVAHALRLYTHTAEALAGMRPTERQCAALAARTRILLTHMEAEGFLTYHRN